MPRSPVLAALLVLALTGARADDPPAIKLIPGTPVEFAVPGLPPTLAQRYRKQVGEPVRMSIQLPADFSPDRSYPVLVFLSGGDGGGGGEMHLARPFLGDQGYVLCNLPLFKPDIAGDNPDQQLTITPRDAAYALPALRMQPITALRVMRDEPVNAATSAARWQGPPAASQTISDSNSGDIRALGGSSRRLSRGCRGCRRSPGISCA